MKKYLVLLAAVMMVIAMVSEAFAEGTIAPTAQVNATVVNLCTTTNNGVIDFPDLTVGDTGTKNATVTTPPTIYCSAGSSYTVVASSPNTSGSDFRLKHGTADYMIYTLTFNGSITGEGPTQSIGGAGATRLNLGATIADTAYSTAVPGDYGDLVTFTINY